MSTTSYVWDPLNDSYLMETDVNDAITAVYTQEPSRYGGLISQHRESETDFLHQDSQGSTRFLTDESGALTDTFVYDAWGNETERTGTTETPFRWIGVMGYYLDEEFTDYYIRARVLDSAAGRWISTDPIGILTQDSLYAYVSNAPLCAVDPSGLWRFVSGMGSLSGTFEPSDVATYGPASSSMDLQFDPVKKLFIENHKDTCCKEIRFIQIFYMDVKQLYGTLPNRVWTLDPYRGKPPYYPEGTFRDPGGPGAKTPSDLIDAPNFQNLYRYPRPSGLSLDLETCAVCSKSKTDQPKGIGDVFGCVRWGHSFQIEGPIWNVRVSSWKRYVENDVWTDAVVIVGGPKGANNPIRSFQGIANEPSDNMKPFLDKYFP